MWICFQQFPPAQREYSFTHSLALLRVADKAGGGKFMRSSLFCARAPANFLRVARGNLQKKVSECQKPLNRTTYIKVLFLTVVLLLHKRGYAKKEIWML